MSCAISMTSLSQDIGQMQCGSCLVRLSDTFLRPLPESESTGRPIGEGVQNLFESEISIAADASVQTVPLSFRSKFMSIGNDALCKNLPTAPLWKKSRSSASSVDSGGRDDGGCF